MHRAAHSPPRSLGLLAAAAAAGMWLAGCGGASYISTPTPAPTPTPTPLPLPAQVELPPGSSSPMAVDGDTLVWVGVPKETGSSCPQYDLYEGDLRLFRPKIIWRSKPCLPISEVRISNDWIVWVSGQDPAGTIWALNRSTRRVTKAAAQPFYPANHPCPTLSCTPAVSFSLEGQTLVWSHFDLGTEPDSITSSIKERSLPKGPVRTVFQRQASCEMQIDPELAGRDLVWVSAHWPQDVSLADVPSQQCEGVLQTDVMSKMAGPRFGRLIAADGQSTSPATNGTAIVWESPAATQVACVCSVLHLIAKPRANIQTVGSQVTDYVLTKRYLAWSEKTTSGTRLELLNLASRAAQTLAASGAPTSGTFIRTLGSTSGSRLVWERDVVKNAVRARVFVGIKDLH